MKVKTLTGEVLTVNPCYGERLVQQGAVVIHEAKEPGKAEPEAESKAEAKAEAAEETEGKAKPKKKGGKTHAEG